MRMITKDEECSGKYCTKEEAIKMAEFESDLSGKRHIHFLSHYHCPYDHFDKMYWGILVKLPYS